ncbi:unnamed protein product [Discosporangium mesarthrocarpum]
MRSPRWILLMVNIFHLDSHRWLGGIACTIDPISFWGGELPGEDATDTSDDKGTFLDELLDRCREATRSKGAMESTHTGSSEWAGFRTTPELLQGVSSTLARAYPRSRRSDGSAMCWSWLTLAPQPLRVEIATDPRFSVYLTVLPAGNGSPPAHRPIYGSQVMSRVLAGEVEQVKSNSKRVIARSQHSPETPVWSSFGGGGELGPMPDE